MNMAKFLFPLITVVVWLAALNVNINMATARVLETCHSSGYMRIKATNGSHCSIKSDSKCCERQKTYPQFHCSPLVTLNTRAIMTMSNFGRGMSIDGSRANVITSMSLDRLHCKLNAEEIVDDSKKHDINKGSTLKCGNSSHGDWDMIVALSTGWYNGGSRCSKIIRIKGNGKVVLAKIMDECDSVNGCDSGNSFQMPCANNIVEALPAVWKALGIPESKVGKLKITWSDV